MSGIVGPKYGPFKGDFVCTLSWTRREDGYALLFNRDERVTRHPGIPPRESGEDVRWIAPVDGDFGGTWIAANELGVTMGVLNGPDAPSSGSPLGSPRSRGLLVRDLAESRSVAAFREGLAWLDPSLYRPFRIFALSPDEPLAFAEWDSVRLAIDDDAESRRPIISSAFRESEVERRRLASYARFVPSGPEPPIEELDEFHRSHFPERGAHSVCMHRSEAETRSLTRIEVGRREVRMTYHAGPPCTPSPVSSRTLSRSLAPRGDIR
jgi:hypothetical protein